MADASAIDRLWAGWRSEYVGEATAKGPGPEASVFVGILESGLPDETTNIVWRGDTVFAILNAYPYGTGHLLVMPYEPIPTLEGLSAAQSNELWVAINQGVVAVKTAYSPAGVNVGFNLGAAAGAGVPTHLHAHVLPRWHADTNFMSAVANARVLPEALSVTAQKLRDAWPRA